MSGENNDGGHGMLEKIFDMQVNHGERLSGIETDVRSIKTQCVCCTAGVQDIGRKAAIHDSQIERHEKRLSDIYHKLEMSETTGVIHLTEEKTRWRTLKIVGVIVISIVTFLSGIFGLAKAIQNDNGANRNGRIEKQ